MGNLENNIIKMDREKSLEKFNEANALINAMAIYAQKSQKLNLKNPVKKYLVVDDINVLEGMDIE